MATAPIKSMNPYSGPGRIHKNIAALGLGPDDPLTVETLARFDRLHYHGTDAIDVAIRDAATGASDRILDIGGGWGGPARRSRRSNFSPTCTPSPDYSHTEIWAAFG